MSGAPSDRNMTGKLPGPFFWVCESAAEVLYRGTQAVEYVKYNVFFNDVLGILERYAERFTTDS